MSSICWPHFKWNSYENWRHEAPLEISSPQHSASYSRTELLRTTLPKPLLIWFFAILMSSLNLQTSCLLNEELEWSKAVQERAVCSLRYISGLLVLTRWQMLSLGWIENSGLFHLVTEHLDIMWFVSSFGITAHLLSETLSYSFISPS